MKRAWKGYALIAPMLAGFLLFYVVPFGQVMWDSLSQGTGKSQLFVGFYNYQRMFQNKMFLAAFGNTLKFLGLGLPLVLLLAYGLALFLKSRARRSPVLRGVFLLPYVMPVAGTVLLIDLLFSERGLMPASEKASSWHWSGMTSISARTPSASPNPSLWPTRSRSSNDPRPEPLTAW